jgi:hypothetical protein
MPYVVLIVLKILYQVQWHTFIISASQEAEVAELWFKNSLSKVTVRTYQTNN